MLSHLWAGIYTLVSWRVAKDTQRSNLSTTDCLSSPTLPALVACYSNFTVPQGFYDDAAYATAQPTPDEEAAFRAAVMRMLDISDGAADCFGTTLPDALRPIYSVHPFVDQDSGEAYCVLAEKRAIEGSYTYGWGFMAVPDEALSPAAAGAKVPDSPRPRLDVHLAAPHPVFDGPVDLQAAALFAEARARSLFVSGRHRRAYDAPSDCVNGTSKTPYYKTDPAHSVVAIKDWQDEHGGCPAASCAYIQLHGKADTSCPQDTAFISSGLGHDDASLEWYLKKDLPARRLQAALVDVFPKWNVSMPTDSNCTLTASKTVFGRYVNGVSRRRLCSTSATPKTASGEFVHIEQATESRAENAYDGWLALPSLSFNRASFLRLGIVQRSVGDRLISIRRAGRDEEVPNLLRRGRVGRAGIGCGAVTSAAAGLAPVGVSRASSSVTVRPPRSGRAQLLAETTIGERSYSDGGWAEYVRDSDGVGGKCTPRAASQGVEAGSLRIGRGLSGMVEGKGIGA
ncbi:hypothetical protein HDZ31DRAFT_79550 [Schizophyllum fasciatum]